MQWLIADFIITIWRGTFVGLVIGCPSIHTREEIFEQLLVNMLIAVANPWEYIEHSITHMCSYIYTVTCLAIHPSTAPSSSLPTFPNAKYITFSTKPIVYITIHNNQQEHNDTIKQMRSRHTIVCRAAQEASAPHRGCIDRKKDKRHFHTFVSR